MRGDDAINLTELNKTANGTYSAHGISFKCPDNWNVISDNIDGNNMIAASPIHESNITELKNLVHLKLKGLFLIYNLLILNLKLV